MNVVDLLGAMWKLNVVDLLGAMWKLNVVDLLGAMWKFAGSINPTPDPMRCCVVCVCNTIMSFADIGPSMRGLRRWDH